MSIKHIKDIEGEQSGGIRYPKDTDNWALAACYWLYGALVGVMLAGVILLILVAINRVWRILTA